jgi:DNA-binding response OmpR family regulator
MNKVITRVMLAEDEEVARDILSFYLNTIFDEVVVVKDGLDGLYTYKQYFAKNITFDLVLTDIKMPNMDGIEMLEKIHSINEKQKFIIVSAFKDEEKLLKSIDLRVLGYFVKPLNVDNIMHLLKKAKVEVLEEKNLNNPVIKINSIFSYDTKEKLLYEKNSLVNLSKKESQLLDILVNNMKKIVPAEELKIELWADANTSDSTLRTVMKRLKDKIKTKDFIISRKAQGYIIE